MQIIQGWKTLLGQKCKDMSVLEAKAIYDMLQDSGELEMMFPQATGEWFEDRVN